jgi:hypothetical protein
MRDFSPKALFHYCPVDARCEIGKGSVGNLPCGRPHTEKSPMPLNGDWFGRGRGAFDIRFCRQRRERRAPPAGSD